MNWVGALGLDVLWWRSDRSSELGIDAIHREQSQSQDPTEQARSLSRRSTIGNSEYFTVVAERLEDRAELDAWKKPVHGVTERLGVRASREAPRACSVASDEARVTRRTSTRSHNNAVGVTVVSSPGSRSPSSTQLEDAGVAAVLVGETLMRSTDPEAALNAARTLQDAARRSRIPIALSAAGLRFRSP